MADEESDCSNIEKSGGPQSCNSLQRSKYPSQDGTCNNLKHPMWGRANIALTRLLQPDYEDGNSFERLLLKSFFKMKNMRTFFSQEFQSLEEFLYEVVTHFCHLQGP